MKLDNFILFGGMWSSLIVYLFVAKQTTWACQVESPGRCQLSEMWGLLINCLAMELCAMKTLWGTAERWKEEKRGPTVPLHKWRKSWSKKEKTEREYVSQSEFPSPVTRSSDSFVASTLSSWLWLPEYIRGPVWNLTSQYFNIEILILSSQSTNCCLVIGYHTCGTGNQDVLASSIMLCHGSRRTEMMPKWRKINKF